MTQAAEVIDPGGVARQCWVFGPVAEGHLQRHANSRLWWCNGIELDAWYFREDGPKVRTILVSSTLFLTVVSSVGLGVVSAYASIHGILLAFAQRTRPQRARVERIGEEQPMAALVAQEVPVQQ